VALKRRARVVRWSLGVVRAMDVIHERARKTTKSIGPIDGATESV